MGDVMGDGGQRGEPPKIVIILLLTTNLNISIKVVHHPNNSTFFDPSSLPFQTNINTVVHHRNNLYYFFDL